MPDFINEIFIMTCIFTLRIPQEMHNLKLSGVKTCELGLYYLLFRHSFNKYSWSGFSIADTIPGSGYSHEQNRQKSCLVLTQLTCKGREGAGGRERQAGNKSV